MARYTVKRSYRSFSDGQQWGPWVPGEVVELDDDRAAWVNRDAAGTLVPAAPAEPAAGKPADPPRPRRRAGRNGEG